MYERSAIVLEKNFNTILGVGVFLIKKYVVDKK